MSGRAAATAERRRRQAADVDDNVNVQGRSVRIAPQRRRLLWLPQPDGSGRLRSENFDQTGAWRATDKDDASCMISGDGQLYGLGDEPVTFKGPAQLESVLMIAASSRTVSSRSSIASQWATASSAMTRK